MISKKEDRVKGSSRGSSRLRKLRKKFKAKAQKARKLSELSEQELEGKKAALFWRLKVIREDCYEGRDCYDPKESSVIWPIIDAIWEEELRRAKISGEEKERMQRKKRA